MPINSEFEINNRQIIGLWHCGGCLIKQAARYARRQAPATNRHNTTNKNRETAEKARRRLKYGDTRRLSVFAVFFYAAAIFCFLTVRSFRAVLFAPSFFVPFTFRYLAATLCAVLLLCNTFIAVNYLSMPPLYLSWYGIMLLLASKETANYENLIKFFQKGVYFCRFRGYLV